ncbi:MAG: hypothetical protein P8O91_05755 [Luminiphilus sp.]|nr:hypothetical protein [Luminiphilus sp.]
MNSDKIRERFGHYGVELLKQDTRTRLASLYSLSGERRVTRTLALTRFELPTHPEVEAQDAQIRSGESIGATLRNAGWTILKNETVDCQVTAGQRFALLGGSTLSPEDNVLLRIYTLNVSKQDLAIDYAIIAEAYHCDHIAPSTDLPSANAVTPSLTKSQALALAELLAAMQQTD